MPDRDGLEMTFPFSYRLHAFAKVHFFSLCILTLTVAGLILRLYGLGHQGYFSEEVFTSVMVADSYTNIFNAFLTGSTEQPALFYLAAKALCDLAGSFSLEMLRLPAAILGVLGIPAIAILGKEYHSEFAGIIAALIYTSSERMVFYSQYCRPYTMVFLFFIIAAFWFIRIRKQGYSRYPVIAFMLCSALCIWTHYYSSIPICIMWGILLWELRGKIIPYAIALMVLSLPFILYLRSLIIYYASNELSHIYPQTYFSVSWIDNFTRVPYECFGYAGLLIVPLAALYAIRKKDPSSQYLLGIFLMTYASTLALTLLFNPSARYAVLTAPLIIVIAAAEISDIISKVKIPNQKVAVIVVVIYAIVSLNILQLISWYTTEYHFVFL